MHKRFTKNLQMILSQAKERTGNKELNGIDAIEIIRFISSQRGSLGKAVLESLHIDMTKFDLAYKELEHSQKVSANELLKIASKVAYLSNSPYVGTEHLVHGFFSLPQILKLTKPDESIKGTGGSISDGEGQERPDLFGDVHSIIDNFFSPERSMNTKSESVLDNFCHDLGRSTKKDHVLIGREKELERISYILGRKMKNNPVLVGDPGVGKTAIVEGLSQKIDQGKAPYYLVGKKILSLDLGLLIAGTTFRGEFESRLKEVIGEAKNDPNVILFIDEIHNLIGAGNAVGGMDAANLLKPAMSRGEIQVIGATTFDEYQKHIRKDSALERRFQPIMVKEPTQQETVKILRGIRPSYEKYHNVKISDEALEAASALAKRYLTERFLPDSAIDLIDETAARLRSGNSNTPLFQQIKFVESKRERIIDDKELSIVSDRYEQAIKMRQEEKKISQQLKELKKKLEKIERKKGVYLEEDDIRSTLSQITNIPGELLSEQDHTIAKRVRKVLRENLVGQSQVHREVHNTVLRQVSGITNPNRPLGSFLFIGPTGIGKTYTAKLLGQAISPQGERSLVQINMSEFSERHNISRLLGAPAGYVGYEESGELTEKIRKNPYSVVLFDEIEKAEIPVLNILLQILEEGEITDAKGRNINFRNTIVILTSNIGTSELDSVSQIGFSNGVQKMKKEYERTREAIQQQLQQILSSELLNRLDSTIIFDPLSKKHFTKITQREFFILEKRLLGKNIKLSFDKKVIDHIVESGADHKNGARSIRRTIQNIVEPLLAQKMLSRKKPSAIQLKLENDKLTAIGK